MNRSDAVVEDAVFGILGAVGVQDVVQGNVPHQIPDAFIEVLPDAAGRAEFAAFAFFGALDAVHDGDGAFHDFQYLQQGDLLRIFGQMEAAVHAAHGADEPCSAQIDHQTADVFFGDLLRLGNIPDQARLFGVVHGQIDQDPQSIASFGRDFHERFCMSAVSDGCAYYDISAEKINTELKDIAESENYLDSALDISVGRGIIFLDTQLK